MYYISSHFQLSFPAFSMQNYCAQDNHAIPYVGLSLFFNTNELHDEIIV